MNDCGVSSCIRNFTIFFGTRKRRRRGWDVRNESVVGIIIYVTIGIIGINVVHSLIGVVVWTNNIID